MVDVVGKVELSDVTVLVVDLIVILGRIVDVIFFKLVVRLVDSCCFNVKALAVVPSEFPSVSSSAVSSPSLAVENIAPKPSPSSSCLFLRKPAASSLFSTGNSSISESFESP